MANDTQQGTLPSPNQSATPPHKEILDAIGQNIERSTNFDDLVSAIAVLEDILATALPECGRLRALLGELRDEINEERSKKNGKARPSKSTLELLKQRAASLIENSKIILSTSIQAHYRQELEATSTQSTQTNLDRDISAAITNRYFTSWEFYTVVGILALGVSVWGINVKGSIADLSAAQAKYEEANHSLDLARKTYQQTQDEADKAEKFIRDAREEFIRLTEQRKGELTYIVDQLKSEIGHPAEIRTKIEEDYLEEVRRDALNQAGDHFKAWPVRIEEQQDEAIDRTIEALATNWQVSPPTLEGLVRHQLTVLDSLDEKAEELILADIKQRTGQPIASIKDFALHRASEFESQLSEEFEDGKAAAIAEYGATHDPKIASFADLARNEIDTFTGEAKLALKDVQGAKDAYLQQVDEASSQIPARFYEIDTRMDGIDSRVQSLNEQSAAIGSELGIVKALAEPLAKIAGYLDDPYRRAQIDIATILGNARWLVLASLLISLVAFVLGAIAFRCWLSESSQGPQQPADQVPPAPVAD